MAKIKQKAVICDIDGVLLDTAHIFNKINKIGLRGCDIWKYFNRHANDYDVEIDSRVIEMLEVFALRGFRIIFMTARSSEIWKQTRAKIEMSIAQYSQFCFGFELAMRDESDKRPSDVVKEDLLKKAQKFNSVLFAIDDDPKNCEMFAKNRILTLKVHK